MRQELWHARIHHAGQVKQSMALVAHYQILGPYHVNRQEILIMRLKKSIFLIPMFYRYV